VALGLTTVVEDSDGYFATETEIVMGSIAGMTYVFYGYLLYLVLFTENPSVWRHNFFPLTMMNIIGATVFTTVVFLRTLYMTDETCSAWIWFASVGFSMMYTPLFEQALAFYIFKPEQFKFSIFEKKSTGNEHEHSKRKLIAIGVTASILAYDIFMLSMWMIFEMPKADERHTNGQYDKFQDQCIEDDVAMIIAGLLVGVKAMLVLVGAALVSLAQREGFQRNALIRSRRAILIIGVAGVIVLILDTAFTADPMLNYLVRSLAIITASVGAVHWIYFAFLDRTLLRKYGDAELERAQKTTESKRRITIETEGNGDSMSSSMKFRMQQIDERKLTSMRVFDQLFESEIIRGYLKHQCIQTYDSETVEFCTEVFHFKRPGCATLVYAKAIIDKYIATESEKEINLSHNTRKKVLDQYQALEKEAKARVRGVEGEREEKKESSEASMREESDSMLRHRKSSSDIRLMQLQNNLLKIFDKPFREARRLVYLNNWRPFRDSDFGMAAASWFEWMTFLDNFSYEVSVQLASITYDTGLS